MCCYNSLPPQLDCMIWPYNMAIQIKPTTRAPLDLVIYLLQQLRSALKKVKLILTRSHGHDCYNVPEDKHMTMQLVISRNWDTMQNSFKNRLVSLFIRRTFEQIVKASHVPDSYNNYIVSLNLILIINWKKIV